jgi:7-carboxy-7-deazaguanine synthase
MMISEIFYSIQGEGSLVGMPSVFIRTSGCNLRCVWCDTPYTSWEPDGKEMQLGAILARARSPHWPRYAVVTGGEPMLAEDLGLLTEGLRIEGMHVTIETNGTVYRKLHCDLMSISPKLANSTPHRRERGRFAVKHEQLRYQPDVLKQLMAEYAYQLKFVIQDKEDIAEVEKILDATGADPDRVFLMPEGIQVDALYERSTWMVDACKELRWRFSPRLHIDLFGNKRGT